ncbi:MAG: cation:proton antiporter [Legionellales bacterium]|nr:cation:proton antiporter [Legionellales bacterium]
MEFDHALPITIGIIWLVILIGFVLRRLNQPYVVSYLLAGILLGPSGIGLITDQDMLYRMGEFGVMLLLFFIGMEMDLPSLLSRWRISFIPTFAQIFFSFLIIIWLNRWLEWPLERCLLIAFVISLSSTAVIIKILEEWNELHTRVGQTVVGILIAQDILVVPMLIILSVVGGGDVEEETLVLQIIALIGLVGLIIFLVKNQRIRLPFTRHLRNDHELQVFVALGTCFGMAFLTGAVGLSTALGAFIGGVIMAAARETNWIKSKLESIRVIFVALFFLSVGLLLNLNFIVENGWVVISLVLVVLIVNSFIASLFLRVMGLPLRESIYAGSLLAQIGEFSFVLIASGLALRIVSNYAYQLSIAVIALTLIISPLWIAATKRIIGWR